MQFRPLLIVINLSIFNNFMFFLKIKEFLENQEIDYLYKDFFKILDNQKN